MGVKEDLIAAVQAYALSKRSSDPYFYVAWGAPGSQIEISNVVEDTGQVWENDPNMGEAFMRAIAEVLGDWQAEDFDAVVAGSVTLTKTPASSGTLMVFHAGSLLRRKTSPTLATEYSWSGGKTITFGTAVSGWVHVRYLAD